MKVAIRGGDLLLHLGKNYACIQRLFHFEMFNVAILAPGRIGSLTSVQLIAVINLN